MTRVATAADNIPERDDDDSTVRIGTLTTRSSEAPDPFAQKASSFRTMEGLSAAAKKRASRMDKVHQGVGGAKSQKIETDDLTGYNLFEVISPPYNLDYLAALLTKSSAHYAAVNAKVENIVGLGYEFVDSHSTRNAIDAAAGNEAKVTRMRRKLSEARDVMFKMLDSFNEEDTFDETLKKVWTDYEATGNGYFEIGRKANGQIGYIGHIPSTTMRVRKARDGFIQIISNKAVFFRNFGKKDKNPISGGDRNPNEVIHIKKYNPINSFYGVPDIIAGMQAVTGNEFAARFNLDYFENKAVPRYVVVVKGGTLSSRSQLDIVEFFTGMRGQNHRTLFVPLPADEQDKKTSFEMKPVEAGTQDSSFTNYNKINLRDILMAERVPMTKVGLAEGVNLAVARDADKTFKESVCRPSQRILEKKLGKIFSEITDMFDFKLTELTLTDEDTQSKIDERYLRMQTVVPNEIRGRWGRPGISGGDKVVDLKAQAGAEAAAQGNRQRDANRSANSPDTSGEARAPKGDGRQQG
jgi:PBSX family phage portal protein